MVSILVISCFVNVCFLSFHSKLFKDVRVMRVCVSAVQGYSRRMAREKIFVLSLFSLSGRRTNETSIHNSDKLLLLLQNLIKLAHSDYLMGA